MRSVASPVSLLEADYSLVKMVSLIIFMFPFFILIFIIILVIKIILLLIVIYDR